MLDKILAPLLAFLDLCFVDSFMPFPPKKIRNLLPWLPAILWMITIFYFASSPSPLPNANGNAIPPAPASEPANSIQSPLQIDIPWDKLAHISEYAGLCFWLYIGFISHEKTSRQLGKTLSFAFIVSILYAISDELHQIPVAGRGFEFFDLVMDAIGIVSMMGAIFIYKHLRE